MRISDFGMPPLFNNVESRKEFPLMRSLIMRAWWVGFLQASALFLTIMVLTQGDWHG